MPISHPHQAIFIHIPKTAGTSVEAVLGMHGDKQDIGITPYFNQALDHEHLYGRDLQHITAARLKAVLNDDALFDRYYKFSIVRNPWDRLVSTFAWSEQKWAKGQPLLPAEFDELVRQMYAMFLAAKSSSQPLRWSLHLDAQFHYVVDEQMRPLVNFIARYENLAQDWRRICERLDVHIDLPGRMKSHHRPYREYYGDATRAMVAEMYAQDASLFGYVF